MPKKPGRPRKAIALRKGDTVKLPTRSWAHELAFTAERAVSEHLTRRPPDGTANVEATTQVLNALAALPSDRSKHRVLKFVQDYFDEQHGH